MGNLNSRELVNLRDRCGLLSPQDAWEVLQRLTWLNVGTYVINQAIDDVEEMKVTGVLKD